MDGWERVLANDARRVRRRRFSGTVATELGHYVGGDVSSYIKPGSQGPVLYLNCKGAANALR